MWSSIRFTVVGTCSLVTVDYIYSCSLLFASFKLATACPPISTLHWKLKVSLYFGATLTFVSFSSLLGWIRFSPFVRILFSSYLISDSTLPPLHVYGQVYALLQVLSSSLTTCVLTPKRIAPCTYMRRFSQTGQLSVVNRMDMYQLVVYTCIQNIYMLPTESSCASNGAVRECGNLLLEVLTFCVPS